MKINELKNKLRTILRREPLPQEIAAELGAAPNSASMPKPDEFVTSPSGNRVPATVQSNPANRSYEILGNRIYLSRVPPQITYGTTGGHGGMVGTIGGGTILPQAFAAGIEPNQMTLERYQMELAQQLLSAQLSAQQQQDRFIIDDLQS